MLNAFQRPELSQYLSVIGCFWQPSAGAFHLVTLQTVLAILLMKYVFPGVTCILFPFSAIDSFFLFELLFGALLYASVSKLALTLSFCRRVKKIPSKSLGTQMSYAADITAWRRFDGIFLEPPRGISTCVARVMSCLEFRSDSDAAIPSGEEVLGIPCSAPEVRRVRRGTQGCRAAVRSPSPK